MMREHVEMLHRDMPLTRGIIVIVTVRGIVDRAVGIHIDSLQKGLLELIRHARGPLRPVGEGPEAVRDGLEVVVVCGWQELLEELLEAGQGILAGVGMISSGPTPHVPSLLLDDGDGDREIVPARQLVATGIRQLGAPLAYPPQLM